jgi:hypothetical protein
MRYTLCVIHYALVFAIIYSTIYYNIKEALNYFLKKYVVVCFNF